MQELGSGKRMKKVLLFLLGVLAIFCSLITPLTLFFLFLCLTGLVYRYDGMMDEGTALFVGATLLFFWLVFALFPSLAFSKRIRQSQKRLKTLCFCAMATAFAVGTIVVVYDSIRAFST
jgi:hypothetical protein